MENHPSMMICPKGTQNLRKCDSSAGAENAMAMMIFLITIIWMNLNFHKVYMIPMNWIMNKN